MEPQALVEDLADLQHHADRADLDGSVTDVVGAWLLEVGPFAAVHCRSGSHAMTIRKNHE